MPSTKPSTRTRRRKPARLTKRELNMLAHPPTKGTWLCTKCCDEPILNSVSLGACWLCGTKMGERPKLLWPLYVVACKKAGIEPSGKRWTPDMEEAVAPRKPVKRRTARKRA